VTVGSRVLGGRYRLGSVLGQGGMAVVYRAEDLTLGRTVAVKILRESLGTDPEFLERFRREARAAARLNHPNIIAVYDVGQDGPSNYIVMEYVEGNDLRDLIREAGPLPPDRVVDLGCQIAAALEYAHRSGLVHRDIKSQNVLVTPDGKVKVADFGIAVVLGEGSITQAGVVIGSVHYMAPEQAEGRPTTTASDVYSLGVVLYEMATGRLPFTAETPIAIARLQLEAPPPAPQVVNPRLPLPIAEVILACLEKAPEARPASAALVAAALRGQRAVASSPTAALPVVEGNGAIRQAPSGTRRRPVEAAPPNGPPPNPALQTDVLMPNDRRRARQPVRPARPVDGGGSRFWPLFWITLLLAIVGAVGGWMLAGSPRQATAPTPTAAPVITATLPPPPTTAPVATLPAVQPPPSSGQATPPASPAPTEPPPKPTAPPQPTVTPVPPTPVPPTPAPSPTRPPAKPTVPVGMVNVPDVVNKSEGDAAKQIRDAGLTVKVEERRAPNLREPVVVAQDPPGGGQVLSGSTVTIVVGRPIGPGPKPAPKGGGTVLVPNVEGMDEREAVRTLEDQGFKPEVRRESSRDHKGKVIDQNPGAGDTVQPGVNVRIAIGT
jgi:eukaryotic-like serine/threonine-protein kinase